MPSFDEDLALAISLSLQEQRSQAPHPRDDPILIIDSSDEEELSSSSRPKPSTSKVVLPKPTNNPSTRKSTTQPASSRKSATTNPNQTIDLDSTIEIEEETEPEEENTDTEDESDEEPYSKPNVSARPSSPTKQPAKNGIATSSKPIATPTPPPPLDPMAVFRAERAKMERERIARLKRMRPDVEEKTGGEDSDLDERPSKRPSPTLTSSSSSSKGKSKDATYFGSFGTPDKNGYFWHGAIRQTANKHAIASQDTKPVFRLTEILPPATPSSDPNQTLSFAIVSSYVVDLPWLYQLFSSDVPVILVAQPGTDGRPEVHHALPGWVRASPGLAGGRGCMHVKLMLVSSRARGYAKGKLIARQLFYKSGRLRIVIPTANFVPYDWRDIENSAWVQDIPLRAASSSAPASAPLPSSSRSTPGIGMESFAERLEYVLKSLNVAPALEAHLIDQRASGDVSLPLRSIDELHARWDWTRVTAYLVPSIAGKHTGWPAVIRVGHVALMKAVRDMGATSESVVIECQGSSIGAYSTAWTNEFMSSAKGISPDKWLDTPKARRSKASHPTGLRIVFPSLATVDSSVLGRPGGGTIFCRKQQWDASTFPKELFVDSNSKRGKILMHAKMILGLLSEEGKPPGWLYVGSHNFTPSAWGNLSGSGFTPIMNITNYELGVVIPLKSATQGDALACWKRPARPYVKGKDVPWMQHEHM